MYRSVPHQRAYEGWGIAELGEWACRSTRPNMQSKGGREVGSSYTPPPLDDALFSTTTLRQITGMHEKNIYWDSLLIGLGQDKDWNEPLEDESLEQLL